MELNPKENRDALKWLGLAGSCAVALSAFLYYCDQTMTGASARDRKHAQEMRVLRTAQASLPARTSDSRQTLPLDIEKQPGALPEKTGLDGAGSDAAAAHGSHDHDGHGH